MKPIFISLLIALIFSCSSSIKNGVNIPVTPCDTVYINVPSFNCMKEKNSESDIQNMKYKADSLKNIPYGVYINARRIEKIKYYISICEKRPSNKKFFYGWIKRTMSE